MRKYNKKRTIFIDQDGPLANYEAGAAARDIPCVEAKLVRGFYRDLPIVKGAEAAIREMLTWEDTELFVATKIPDKNPWAATEKLLWINDTFPELEERVIITPNKACLGTPADYLIDDRAHKADAKYFSGTFIHFLTPAYPDWDSVLAVLRQTFSVQN
jgi:5'(3')-deoxyribonucleotidase